MKHVVAALVIALTIWSFAPARPKPVEPQRGQVSQVLSRASSADKARVAAFYSAMADVVDRDQKVIATVGQFRKVHANSLDLAFRGTDLPGKYAGLDTAIEGDLVQAIGREDVALTSDKRQALVAALKGVASAAR